MNATAHHPPLPVFDPAAAEQWLALGHAKLGAEDLDGALACYRQVLQRQPDCEEAHTASAIVLKLSGMSVLAKHAARAALAINPANSIALKVLARVQLDWGNADLARDLCDAVLARDPADADALIMREQCQTEEVILPSPEPGVGTGYDSYISLGDNCEAGLQFRRIGYEESSFFRYTANPFEAVLALIKNDFAGVFRRGNLQPDSDDMVRDTHTGVVFHSGLKSALDPVSGRRQFLNNYEFDEVYGRKDLPKARHLVAKWRALTQSRQDVLYFLKLHGENRLTQAKALLAVFREKYPAHRATILCLQTEDPAEPDWGIPGLINRHLPRFAPFDNTHDADTAAWDRVFAEFPLKTRSLLRPPALSP